MKSVLKIAAGIILALLLIVIAYLAYVFIDYERIEDNLGLDIYAGSELEQDIVNGVDPAAVPIGEELSVISWNIGFGAYTDDYTFFMDGGSESRARSEEILLDTLGNITKELVSFDSDFYMIQEVDVDSTRSYHVNEIDILTIPFHDKYMTFAVNYDSPYLFYPILEPHGKSKAGMLTMSDYDISSATRRSLPIEEGFAKFIDLDRCYSINRIPAANGKELVLMNLHLSAYSNDPTVVENQLKMMYEDMVNEYEKGNYIVCGGDFNKDLLGNSADIFGVSAMDYEWAKSFPFESLPENFKVVTPFDENAPVPSCRNADKVWDPKTNFQLTVDGFLVSDNVEVVKSNVVDLQFACSDHNPVYMNFKLK